MQLPLRGCTIVMASAIPWEGDRHRQHEIARLLSEHCRVLYLEPPGTRFVNAPAQAHGASGRHGLQVTAVTPNLTVVRAVTDLRRGWSVSAAINAGNRHSVARRLRAQFPQLDQTPTILWLDESAAEPMIGLLGERLTVYDAVDEDWAFSRNPLRRRLLKAYETRLTHRADLVFASSQPLYERKRQLNPHTHLALNAVDYEHFARATALMPPGAPVVIGFTGATLLKRTDYDLLLYLAAQRPAWRFELIGPTQWPRRLPRPPNLDCLGPQPYAALPELMSRHSVCIIPYRAAGELSYIHPKKLFEYLAAGKPVVATDMPALRPYGGLVKIGRSPVEFLRKIEECLAENADPDRAGALVEERRALAHKHTWSGLVAGMVAVMEAALAEQEQTSPH